MANIPPTIDASTYFYEGCNSYTDPQALSLNSVVSLLNACTRGGIIQTRPGTKTLFCAGGSRLHGFTFFQPTGGVPHLVYAVDGDVYVSPSPFKQQRKLEGITFNPNSQFVAWATCLKSTDYNDDGELIFLPVPRNVLVMQDGSTRAAYWDGFVSRHLDPTASTQVDPSGEAVTVAGKDETPIGLWMTWSNNRLWLSRGNQLLASDIGNPLKFTEAQYIAEARSFYLNAECTGVVETADQSGIIAFTDSNASFLRSAIQDRTKWLETPDFQSILLSKIGCIAPRSIVTQYGLIWWFSAKGLTNLDTALRQNLSSRISFQDQAMAFSKGNLGPDLSAIAGGYYENYLMMSVPSGDVYNRQTWVMDQAPFSGEAPLNAWNGIWTGWRPVEWAKGIVSGEERVFFASVDHDGQNRIWEAFQADRTDNGCRITSACQTREHNFGSPEYKRFSLAELYAREIYGDVSLMIAYAGTKGAFNRLTTRELVATPGQIYSDSEYGYEAHDFAGNTTQTRTIKTSSSPTEAGCNGCGVESPKPGFIDHAFSLLIVWSGRFGFYGYRMFADPVPDNYTTGEVLPPEEGPRSAAQGGAQALDFFATCEPFPEFTGTGTATANNPTCRGVVTFNTASTSIISQADADAKAECSANYRAQVYLDQDCTVTTYYNTEQVGRYIARCPGDGTGEAQDVSWVTDAGEYSSILSQSHADYLAYQAAVENARIAAVAALVCLYVNDEQSYTAHCPGEIVNNEVVPAGESIGAPITRTVPAGTFQTSSKAASNTLALNEATIQAEADLECFYTNTPQSFTKSCHYVPGEPCGGFQTSGEQGFDERVIDLGTGTGMVYINYDSYSVPDQFVALWKDQVLDSGFVGDSGYCVEPIGPGYGSLSFMKDTAYPTQMIVQVNAPCEGTSWQYEVTCPPIPGDETPEGTTVTITVPFNTFNSGFSQGDADALAYASAQEQADAALTCDSDASDEGISDIEI